METSVILSQFGKESRFLPLMDIYIVYILTYMGVLAPLLNKYNETKDNWTRIPCRENTVSALKHITTVNGIASHYVTQKRILHNEF
tara:strand:+ start:177 stop:434 length:258 start_codon:yes stop_codon:yes gene_type:complete